MSASDVDAHVARGVSQETLVAVENHLNTLRYRATSMSVGNARRPRHSGSLFEHFLIFGAPPGDYATSSRESTAIEMLYRWPSKLDLATTHRNSVQQLGVDEIQHIGMLAFPEARCTLTRRSVTKSSSDLNSLRFGSKNAIEEASNSYCGVLTGRDEVLYVVCVRRRELASRVPSLVRHEALMNLSRVNKKRGSNIRRGERVTLTSSAERTYVSADRIYALVSRFPFMALHFRVLYAMLHRERYEQLSLSASRLQPSSSSSSSSSAAAASTSDGALAMPRDQNALLEMLKEYHRVDVPKLDTSSWKVESVEFRLEHDVTDEVFVTPRMPDVYASAHWALNLVVRRVSAEHLMRLVNATLLERHIVIVSTQTLGLLSALCIALVSLIRPFVWRSTMLSILPDSLSDVLYSPVPFVLGTRCLPADLDASAVDILVYDCDAATLVEPASLAPAPPLPNMSRWIARFERLFAPFAGSPLTTRPTDAQSALLQRIVEEFGELTFGIVDRLGDHAPSSGALDLSDPQHKSELVSRMLPASMAFYRALLDTQLLAGFEGKFVAYLNVKRLMIASQCRALDERLVELQHRLEALQRQSDAGEPDAKQRILDLDAQIVELITKKMTLKTTGANFSLHDGAGSGQHYRNVDPAWHCLIASPQEKEERASHIIQLLDIVQHEHTK
jgi:DENN (AEX-3) domain